GLTPSLARRLGLRANRGALVDHVTPGGPAAKAGVHGGTHPLEFQGEPVVAGGDVVLAVNDMPVRSADDLVRIVTNTLRPGATAAFTVLRAGRSLTIPIHLGARPTG